MFGLFRRAPMTPAAYEARASEVSARLAAGDVINAERLSRSLLELVETRNGPKTPLWAEAHFLRCQVLLRAGDMNGALQHLQSAASFQPSSPDETKTKLTYEMNLGDMLQHLGRIQDAEQLLRASLEARRELYGLDHAGYGYGAESLGSVYLQQGKYEDARQAGNAAARAFRSYGDERYLSALALVLVAQKGLDPDVDAFAALDPAVRKELSLRVIHGGKPVIAPWIAVLWDTLGQLQRDGLPPDSQETCLATLANFSQALGRHSDRIRALETLVQLYKDVGRAAEDQAFVLQGLALAYDQAGEKHKARAAYEQAVQVAAGCAIEAQARVRRNFAIFCSHEGHTQDAERILREALALLGDAHGEEAGRLHGALGILLHHARRWNDATGHLEQSVRLLASTHPESLMAQAHLEFAAREMDCDCRKGMQRAMSRAVRDVVERYVPAELIRDVRVPQPGTNDKIEIVTTRQPTRDEAARIELATSEAWKLVAAQAQQIYGPDPATTSG